MRDNAAIEPSAALSKARAMLKVDEEGKVRTWATK